MENLEWSQKCVCVMKTAREHNSMSQQQQQQQKYNNNIKCMHDENNMKITCKCNNLHIFLCHTRGNILSCY